MTLLAAVRRAIRRSKNDESGAVAIIFALALVPILALVGASIDYSRATALRMRLQIALDSGVLAAAAAPEAERQTVFKQAFDSHFFGADAVANSASLTVQSGFVEGQATATLETAVAKVVGIDRLDLRATSKGRIPGSFEIVMALDVSGSMRFPDLSGRARMDVLKEAAPKLIDSAIAEAPPSSRPKFGFVPFMVTVNIGTHNAAYVTGADDPLFAGTAWGGCVMERAPPHHLSVDYSATNKFRAYIYPPEVDNNNCVNPGNGTNNGYARIETAGRYGPMSPIRVGPNNNCLRYPVAPLPADVAAIKAKLNALTAESNYGTLLSPGVTWGARLLTPDAPFPGAAAHGSGTKKILVVLTDGAQTTERLPAYCSGSMNRNGTPYRFEPLDMGLWGRKVGPFGPRDLFTPYGYLFDSDPFETGVTDFTRIDATLDPLALASCDAAKKLGIHVYTIAVSAAAGPGTNVHDTLRSCATDPSHFST